MKVYYASDIISQNFQRKSKSPGAYKDENIDYDYERPTDRTMCPVNRPCPFVSCRYNLYLDIRSSGNITFNFEGLPIDMMKNSCALDVADENPSGLPLGKIGEIMNLTRERVRQIELEATERISKILL